MNSFADVRRFLLDLVTELSEGLVVANRGGSQSEKKSSFHDVVTIHDKNTEEAIRTAIFERYPESVFLGEEGGWHGPQGPVDEPNQPWQWIVDPIDGTSNFAAGWEHWCISIALVVDGKLHVGVIHQPTTGTSWSADETAYLTYGGEEVVLSLNGSTQPRDGLCATEYPSVKVMDRDPEALPRWREAAGHFRSMRRTGSTALDLAYVADGRAVASFSDGVHPWDVAAGIHIIQAAGGTYRSFDQGVEVLHNWEGPQYVAGPSTECLDVCLRALGIS